jgi:hypothetical protein
VLRGRGDVGVDEEVGVGRMYESVVEEEEDILLGS